MATATNVTAGKPAVAGAIYYAPLSGTALPTDSTTAITTVDAGYVSLGYISDAGVTISLSPESEQIKAWGGDTVLSLNTGRTYTVQFTLLESKNTDAKKLVFGDTKVSGTLAAGITVDGTAEALEGHVIVIDMILNNGTTQRTCFPAAYVTSVGDITYVDNAAVGYDLTLTATPNSAGKSMLEFTKD